MEHWKKKEKYKGSNRFCAANAKEKIKKNKNKPIAGDHPKMHKPKR